jgi:SAM-dependent methyltransferase
MWRTSSTIRAEGIDTYEFPCEDRSQDLTFLYSVFTHMFPGDVARYLSEFSRVLRPGGCVLASMFIMDRGLIPYLQSNGGEGLRALTFSHEMEEGVFHNDPDLVSGATAYSLDRIGAMVRSASLLPEQFVRGRWREDGEFDVNGQDLVILRKPAF